MPINELGTSENPAAQKVQPTEITKPVPCSLYVTSADGLKAVQERYNYWTEKLTDSSFNLSLAVIASNWAVFGSVDKIINNSFSKLSIAAVLLSLAISLIGTHLIGKKLREQFYYAEDNGNKWEEEFEKFKKAKGKRNAWPFTDSIDNIAITLRWCKTWLPFSGGVLFLIALWYPHSF